MLQILLTAFAWYRGWKWYALIPIVSAFIIGLFIGLSSGGNLTATHTSTAALADGLALIAIIILCIFKPKPETEIVKPANCPIKEKETEKINDSSL